MADTAQRAHPTPAVYWLIALFLAVVTAIEVAVPQIEALNPIKVPLLWSLAALKFFTVVGFFALAGLFLSAASDLLEEVTPSAAVAAASTRKRLMAYLLWLLVNSWRAQ